MASIVSPELLEEEIKALVRAGGYKSREEALVHALEALLAANPHLRTSTAVELYREGVVTLSRAAEIAGVEFETFKENLAEKAIPIVVDEESADVLAGAELIRRLREAQ